MQSNLIRLNVTEALKEYNIVLNGQSIEYTKWYADSEDNERFYDGGDQQWTEDEIEAMEDRGQYTMTMNIVKKAIDAEVGIFTANKPKMICMPTREDTGLAEVGSELLDQSYRDSNGLLTIREILFNAYRTNMGFAAVRYDEADKVIFEKLSFRDVKVAPNTKDAMWRNAPWIAISRWVPVEEVKAVYNIPSLSTSFPYEFNSLSTQYKQDFKAQELFSTDRQYVNLIEKYKKIKYRTADGKLSSRIEKRTLIGYEYMWTEVLPLAIKDYPIIPLYSSLSDNPYKYSEMHFLRDPQRFVNKMYNETIRSAQAMSSGKVIVRTSDIPNGDVEAFGDNWANPGAIVELNPGAQEPIVVHPDALNQAYFGMYKEAVQHLHKVSLPEDTMGYGESDGKGPTQDLNAKREMVMDTLKIPAGLFEQFLSTLGKVILQHYQAYVSEDTILKVTGGAIALKEIEDAQKRGLDTSNEKNIKSYIQKEVEQNGKTVEEVEVEISNIKSKVNKVDALADLIQKHETLDMEIEIVTDSYSPTYAASKYNMAERMVEKGALPPDMLLDFSPLPNKEEIKTKVNSIRSLSNQVQGLTKQLEEAQSEIDKKEQDYTQLQRSMTDVKNQSRHDGIYKDERAKSYVNKQAMAMDRQKANQDLEFQIKELLLELKASKESLAGLTLEDIQNAIMNEQQY